MAALAEPAVFVISMMSFSVMEKYTSTVLELEMVVRAGLDEGPTNAPTL